MKVSVVIPLYNKERYILRAVRSVLEQSHGDLELIVVDDGSTDDGPRIVSQVRDPRLVLLRQTNHGKSAARNAGIERAVGGYIALLDADDEWATDHLETVKRLAADFPGAGIYCTGYRMVEPSGRVIKPRWSRRLGRGYVHRYFHSVARGDLIATSSSVCIPIDVLKVVGLFPVNDRLGEDQDMWARVALRYRVAVDTRPTTTYFRNADNRCCTTDKHDCELPYLTRLQLLLDNGQVAGEVRKDIQAYIQQGLFTLVSVNVRNGRNDAARHLLSDPRLRKPALRFMAWAMLAHCPPGIAMAALRTADASRMKYRSFGSQRVEPRQTSQPQAGSPDRTRSMTS